MSNHVPGSCLGVHILRSIQWQGSSHLVVQSDMYVSLQCAQSREGYTVAAVEEPTELDQRERVSGSR